MSVDRFLDEVDELEKLTAARQREMVERLAVRGSWVGGFLASRVRTGDGVVADWVEIDPRLQPKRARVWLFFFHNVRGADFVQRVEQTKIADWRRRLR